MAGLQCDLHSKPTLKLLSNLVVPYIEHKWYKLGLQLLDDNDVKVLSAIEANYRGDVDTCCTKMFEQWLETVINASWNQLIAGLQAPGVKLNKVAEELVVKLGVQTGPVDTHDSGLSSLPLSRLASPYHSSTPQLSPLPSTQGFIPPNNYEVEFGLLVSNIIEMIEPASSTYIANMKHALAHVNVHTMSQKPLFNDSELAQIKQCETVYDITERCRKHWSWNKYALLKLIVKKSDSEKAKSELKRFQRTVNARQKLRDLEDKWVRTDSRYSEDFENMIVIFDEDYDDISLDQLDQVESFLSKTTHLPQAALEVTRVGRSNSVLIEWRIPKEAVPYVLMLAYQNKSSFMRRSFLLLRIAGMEVFNLCRSPLFSAAVKDTVGVLRRANSSLSEDCETYMAEVSQLSMQNDWLTERIRNLEMDLKKSQSEKDVLINQLKKDNHKLTKHVEYLNKKVDGLMQLLPKERAEKRISTERVQTDQPEYLKKALLKDTKQLSEDESGGSSLALFPQPASGLSSSDLDPKKYDRSRQPAAIQTPTVSSTTVKERISAINTKTEPNKGSTTLNRPIPRQRTLRSKTPPAAGQAAEQTDELQAMFIKRQSQGELDQHGYEQYESRIHQSIYEQKQLGVAGAAKGTWPGLSAALKKQQKRASFPDADF